MTAAFPLPKDSWSLRRLTGPLRRKIWLARGVLAVEGLWRAAKYPIIALACYAIAGLCGWPQLLPGIVRVPVLFGLTGRLLWLLWFARHALAPTKRVAVQRVEQDAQMRRGSLDALADKIPADAPVETQALWAMAITRLQKSIGPVPWTRPHLNLKKYERRILLPGLLITTLAALIFANHPGKNLLNAFSPWATSLEKITLTAWIRPPDYTGQPPRQIMLFVGGESEIEAPAGSRLVLTTSGADGMFRLIGPGLDQQQQTQNNLGDFSVLLKQGHYVLRLGTWRPVGSWSVRLTKDGAPHIAFDGDIRVSLTRALDLNYKADDDYGVSAVFLAIIKQGKAIAVPLPEPSSGTHVSGHAFKDLTASRHAGETVQLRLVARDATGSFGVSSPLQIKLPERIFTHPVARQIIAARKQVWTYPQSLASPAARLEALSGNPATFNQDLTIYSALRRSMWRLRSDQAWTEIDGITDFLWETALDVEAQKTGKDMAELRKKFEQLMSQMQNGADKQKMMDQLMQEMAQYMASKANSDAAMTDGAGQAMGTEVMEQLLQEMQDRMAAGDTDGARRAMEALQALLENSRFSPGQASSGPGSPSPLMQALGHAIRQQQQLLTQSRAAGASEAQDGAPSDTLQPLAKAQSELARQIDQTKAAARSSRVGTSQLDKASQAMREAAAALEKGDIASAARGQAQALTQLGMARQAIARAESGKEQSQQGELPAGADPLGRNGSVNGPELRLPTISERQRVQQIRALLEERAADPDRPESERAYILRLLRRF
jgi:Domain of unknown function (DUF4175)